MSVKCNISTKDGLNLKVEVNKHKYNYDVKNINIDVSDLVIDISKIFDILEIDDSTYLEYVKQNEVDDDFKELHDFVVTIINSYNEAINTVNKEIENRDN